MLEGALNGLNCANASVLSAYIASIDTGKRFLLHGANDLPVTR